MPEQTITITHPNGAIAGFTLQSLAYKEGFEDMASELSLKVSKNHTILEDSRVTYFVDGSLKLIGQVDNVDTEQDDYDVIEISSGENLFNYRNCQPYTYPDGTTLNAMLSDAPPTTGGRAGLIYWMNSGLDPAWTLHSGYIYKMVGAGTARLGSCDLYENATKLTRATTLAGVTAGKYYQDANVLYVWTTDSVHPMYRLMSVPNWRDTMVRLGTIENGTTSWTVPFKVDTSTGMTVIIGILWAKLQEAKWVPNVDGYIYLTSQATIGRGSESAPVAVFKYGTRRVSKISKMVATGQERLNSVIAMGAGTGSSQIMQAVTDLSTTKLGQVWRSGIYDAPACFSDQLSSLAGKVLAERRDNKIYSVKGPADWALTTGDSINIIANDAMPVVKRIMAAEFRWPENTMALEAGRRQVNFSDAFKKRLDILRTLSSMAQSVCTQWSESFDGNIDDAHPLKSSFELPSDKIDESFPHRFTLRIGIEAYETDTESVTTAAHDNGGVTGSHSGYGGGTSAKTQTRHSVASFTGISAASQVDCMTTVTSAGSHSHSVSNSVSSSTTGSAGDPAHSHYHTEYSAYSSTGTGGSHNHSGYYYAVSQANHVHSIPSHSTQDASTQDHEWGTGGGSGGTANSRAVFTEPMTPAQMAEWIKTHDTGNSIHYLDVTVKLNGTQVPGSPVLDLYIGDDTGDLDITSLIVEGNNEVEVSIEDHSDPSDPVRCNIKGSVGAEYYIDNYA